MCEVKISMFQLCRQVGMLIAIAYVSNYRSMSDLKCKQIHLNPHWHELWKQEKCSSLAPPRDILYKTR